VAGHWDSWDLLVRLKLSSPTLKICYENIGVDEDNFSLWCLESVVDFICKAPAIVRSLRHIETAFCRVLDRAFSYNGRCSPSVEFFWLYLVWVDVWRECSRVE